MQVHGKFNFHRLVHFFLTNFHDLLHDRGKRKGFVFKDVGKGHQGIAFGHGAVAYHMVLHVQNGAAPAQRAVVQRGTQVQFLNVDAVVHRRHKAVGIQIKGIESFLGFFNGHFGRRQLNHFLRILGRKAQAHAPFHNVFAQTQGHVHHAFFGTFGRDGVEIDRTAHARKGGVEAVVVGLSHNFLQNNTHALFVDEVEGAGHVGLAGFVIHRGVNAFDGIGHLGGHAFAVVGVCHHVGRVNARKRLVVTVLQHARRTNGHRSANHPRQFQ